MSGYHMSFLFEEAQSLVLTYLERTNFKKKVTVKKSKHLKAVYEKENRLTIEQIETIMEGRNSAKKEKAFSINREKPDQFSERLPDDEELEKLFIEFISKYFTD